jgi:hypothetical protein
LFRAKLGKEDAILILQQVEHALTAKIKIKNPLEWKLYESSGSNSTGISCMHIKSQRVEMDKLSG